MALLSSTVPILFPFITSVNWQRYASRSPNDIQRAERLDRRASIERASAVRLSPILMTTAAMVADLVPLAFASGAGAAARFSIECSRDWQADRDSVYAVRCAERLHAARERLFRRERRGEPV